MFSANSAPSLSSVAPDWDGMGLWRGHVLAGSGGSAGGGAAGACVLPTGCAALDAQLPGGGWPVGALIELLQAPGAAHDWQLLLPALAARLRTHSGPLVLVGGARADGLALCPFAPALAAQGLPAERLLWVQAGQPAALLWATEQALRCAQVAAVLAWLPQAGSGGLGALRRLHLVAQTHGQLLWLCRPASARHESSPAPLRLLLGDGPAPHAVHAGAAHAGAPAAAPAPGSPGAPSLALRILKRRGPAMLAPLQLPAGSLRLQALLAATQAQRARRAGQGAAAAQPAPLAPWLSALLQTASGAGASDAGADAGAGLAGALTARANPAALDTALPAFTSEPLHALDRFVRPGH